MNRTALLLSATVLAGASFVAVAAARPGPQIDQPAAMPAVSFIGHDSLITERRFARVTTKAEWVALLEEHLGDRMPMSLTDWPLPPVVDFDRYQIVAFFRGSAWNTNGEFVVSVEDRGADWLVRFDSSTFQTMGPDGGGMRATPFGIWILPRTSKPIVIEENVQGLIGKPPVWKEQHRFEGLQ